MDANVLIDVKARLAEEGCCIVPDLIPSEKAARLTDRLWALAEQNAREGSSCFLPEIDPNKHMVRVLNPIQADHAFHPLVENEVALELARTVVGQSVILANCTANIAQPGARSMALHSDLAFILPEPWLYPWSVNVVWCLTDAHPDNGATLYIPGSHKWRTQADVPADPVKMLVPFEAKAGSIIVMDGRLWHTSGANITRDENRALLFGYYSAPFLRPMMNWTEIIPPEQRRSFSPVLQDLLCFEVFANTSEGNREGQGHWKGRPVGVEEAMADFRSAKAVRDATVV